MKIVKQSAALLCVAVFLFASCKRQTPPELTAIPANAIAVVGIEARQIVKKGGLNEPASFRAFEKMQKQLANLDDANQRELLKQLMTDPKTSGLKGERLFIFAARAEKIYVPDFAGALDHPVYFGFVTSLSDAAKFEASVTTFLPEEDHSKIEDMGTYKSVFSGDVTMAWNDGIGIMLFGSSDARKSLDLPKFFSGKEDESIVSNNDFKTFNQRSYDVGVWAEYTQITKLPMGILYGFGYLFKLRDYNTTSYIHGYLDFDNGEMNWTQQLPLNITGGEDVVKEFDRKILKDFPESSYLMWQVALNPKKYIENLKQLNPDVAQKFINDDVQYVIDALGGDLLLDIYGFGQGTPIPLGGIEFTINSKNDFDRLRNELAQSGVNVIDEGDHYTVSFMVVTIQFAWKDGRVLITDDETCMKAFLNGRSGKTLAGSPVGKLTKDAFTSLYLDLNLDNYPESLRATMRSMMKYDYERVVKLLSGMRDLRMSHTMKEGTLSLRFKTNENSLKQLLHSIDDFIASGEQ